MTKHYSPARRESYRDAESRRRERDVQRRQARTFKNETRQATDKGMKR